MGFNMIRKHIKVEPMIWYHHCDQMGLLVFQDFVCGGAPYKKRLMYLAPFFHFHFDDRKPSVIQDLGRIEPKSRSNFYEEVAGTVQRLYNTPSIIGWTLFNEGWGQFETIQNLSLLKAQDFTRPIDANSGWFDQGVGDFDSHHEKGDAIKDVLAYYGYHKDQAIAFGDDYQDLTMVPQVGIFVCVGNGKDDVKKAATYVSKPIAEDGILESLQHYHLV